MNTYSIVNKWIHNQTDENKRIMYSNLIEDLQTFIAKQSKEEYDNEDVETLANFSDIIHKYL